ncbi:unnamed protein product [Clonostachys rhizophaga]|uniref:Alpha/beta hydrolase fold-3 domain-containing protein n=1 Tax=Clonostachys rhizophaga TaxID=160324 RepID=A0A9N9YNP6_9HYPO|nr:unnamed protein product [Clonostachys rhizophaga]
MGSLLSHQPLKALGYLGFALVVTPCFLLANSSRFLFSSLRQDPAWSMKTALICAYVRLITRFVSLVRDQPYEQAKAATFKERCVRIEPSNPKHFIGPIAEGSVKPRTTTGVWFPSLPDAAEPDEKVAIHYPGGAFILAFGVEMIGALVADNLVEKLGANKVLYAQYRLSRDEESRFPAAVQDAVTFYSYVLSLGFKPENIIISGDSAGGNVALALLRYLETNTTDLPLPSAVITWSPWVEVPSDAGLKFDAQPNSHKDMLSGAILQWGADSYGPASMLDEEVEAMVNPLHHPFKTRVPIFLHAGSNEGFCATIKEFSQEMAALNGQEKIKYHETPLAPHDIFLTHPVVGMGEQNITAIKLARSFLEKCRRGVEQPTFEDDL